MVTKTSKKVPARKKVKATTRPAKTSARRGSIEGKVTANKVTRVPKTAQRKSKVQDEDLPRAKKRVGKVVDAVEKKAKKILKEVEAATGVRSKIHSNIANEIDNMLDGIEKDYSLSNTSMDTSEHRLSTGSLELDIILGRGIVPGWYTVFGPEQSCKSTEATTIMGAALTTNVPIISYWDYEGSSSTDYITNILRIAGINMSIEDIFGVRDPKTSHWTIKPRVRFYAEGVAEKFFDYLAKLERALPDKICVKDKWYLVYPGKVLNSQGKPVMNKAAIAIVKDDYDKNYFRKTGKYRIAAEDDSLQALVIVDSYPAMLPEKQDVDDPNNSIAMQARMFSDQIKRVKGKLKAKRIAVIGVNQLRKVPMAMYGPSESEPCGEALKFFSDCRLKFTPRALSGVPEVKGKGMLEEEDSVTGEGVDTYRYIHVRAQKNKLSTPNLEGWMRLWITDCNGEGMGFDPVWDTFRYLRQTGQIVGKRNGFKFNIKGKETKTLISWMEFKTMVLGTSKQIKEVCADLKFTKPFRVREFCRKQLASGVGIDLYFATKKAGHGKDVEDEGGGDEEESEE